MSPPIHGGAVFRAEARAGDNALLALLAVVDEVRLAAERERYDPVALTHLLPLAALELWDPGGGDPELRREDVRRFALGDARAARGRAAAGRWHGPFLALSHRAGPESALSEAAGGALGDAIGCVLSIAGGPPATLRVPYDAEVDRYAVEIWGRDARGLRELLGPRGQAALERGGLVGRPDLVDPGDTPLHLDVTWTALPEGGASDGPHRLGFALAVRRWDGSLAAGPGVEHVLEPACGIGLHRHREGRETLLLADGEASLVVADWTGASGSTRAFEVRRLTAGHCAVLDGGDVHGVMNRADVPASLVVFAGDRREV